MSKRVSYLDPSKIQQIFYINEPLLRKLKAYALEIGISFQTLIANEFSVFEQGLITKSTEIDKIRFKALEESKKLSEEQQIVDAHPVTVSGTVEDPIGNILIEEPITN